MFCRNIAFTYFDEACQREVAASLRTSLRDDGVLVVGIDEHVPADASGFAATAPGIYLAVPVRG